MDKNSFSTLQIGTDVFLLETETPCPATVVRVKNNSVVVSFAAGQTKAVYPDEIERLGVYRRREVKKERKEMVFGDDILKELLKRIYEQDNLSGVISKRIRREFRELKNINNG